MENSTDEKVIKYVQQSIESHKLLPGDRLPAERKLAELLDVSRSTVRNAIQKLELYGIVTVVPQSGTFVTSSSKHQIDMLIDNALSIGRYDFKSLMAVRALLEAEALRLCALNHTQQDLDDIVAAYADFEQNINTERRQEADFNFHLMISKGSHNPVIHSMLLSIIPDTLRYYKKWALCRGTDARTRAEHRDMVNYITSGGSHESSREIIDRHLSHPHSMAK